MDYGEIIKRAWHVTWRYKALWVLGLFAGISGCQGGGSPGSSGTGGRTGRSLSSQNLNLPSNVGVAVERLLPVIVAASIGLFFVVVVWGIMSIAARGGLIAGVNGIEEGRQLPLGDLWRTGFSRWWSVFGLGLLLNLPVALLALFIIGGALLPLIPLAASHGASQSAIGAAAVVPVCGTLAIGIPLLIVAGFVLGIMYLIALRYLIMGGQGVIEAAGNSWRFFRNRVKDCVLMYIISGALNIAAGIVVAIPIGIVVVAAVVPTVFSARAGNWAVLAGAIAVAVVASVIIGLAYNAIWGTYTSTLWTLFFRRVQGMYPADVAGTWSSAPAWQPPAPPAPYQPQAPWGQPPAPPASVQPPYPPPPFMPPAPPAPPVEPTSSDV